MMIKKKIRETEAFKSLDKVKKIVFLSKNNIELIRHGHKMSCMTSFENWVKVCSPKNTVHDIVKELLENQKPPNQ